MSRSRRTVASSLRHGLSSVFAAMRRNGSPARLARSAGRASGICCEPLEERKLLFTLTITEADVNDSGLGVVNATFGYTIPYLFPTAEIEDDEPEIRVEDFNSDDPAAPPANIPSGFIFDASFLRVTHNISPGSNIQLRPEPGGEANENLLQVRPNVGETFTFDILDDDTAPAVNFAARSIRVLIEAATGTATGLPLNNTVVSLLFQGTVIASFTGAALGNLNITNPGSGIGVFEFVAPETLPAFTELRFETVSGPNEAYTFDDFEITLPAGEFVALMSGRIYGATITFAGPVGASVQVLDLYGRDMVRTIALGVPPEGGNLTLVDLDDNGVPNFNDGIGRIIVSNGDINTAVTMFGGTIEQGEPDPAAFFSQGGFNFFITDTVQGLYTQLEQDGFGYDLTDDPEPEIVGLPAGPGSLVIGAPYVRDNTSSTTYNPAGLAAPFPVLSGFNRADQGIFVNDGRNIGSVYIHGVVHGSSRFTGAVDQLVFGTLLGSVSVEGDLGALVVGSDAGVWEPDAGAPGVIANPVNTSAQLVVGRTLNEFTVAGRSLMDITVVGDLDNPSINPRRDVFRYYEKEHMYAIDPGLGEAATILATLNNTDFAGFQREVGLFTGFFGNNFRVDQALAYGDGFLRNDIITSAEWIGSIATAAEIEGTLNFADPVSAEDPADVFAFAVDGSQPITAKIDSATGAFLYARFVDSDGRVLSATQFTEDFRESQFLRFTPQTPGVYYLVLTAATDGAFNSGIRYVVTVNGLAATNVGAIRAGAGLGADALPIESTSEGVFVGFPVVTLLSGSVGSIRMGTGFVGRAGADRSPIGVVNTDDEDADSFATWRGWTISIPGHLYNITAGGDINADAALSDTAAVTQVLVGGDFGTLVTGLSPAAGVGPLDGDIANFRLQVGGRIALLDIRGAIGIDQDSEDPDSLFFDFEQTIFTTGTAGGAGHIGLIRVGAHISGHNLTVNTPPNSIIGGFLVSQDIQFDPDSDLVGIYSGGPLNDEIFRTGAGSDIRFTDLPRIDLEATVDAITPIVGNTAVEFVDDGGGTVRIQIIGGTSPGGFVRVIPVSGSEGVTVAQVHADLSGGARLVITGLGPVGSSDVISIGRIVVTGADAASSIGIVGNTQVDVWRIIQTGGTAFDSINNDTPFGDIVAIDVVGINEVSLLTGDLGRTQVVLWGPDLIGPFLGLAAGAGAAVGGAIGIDPASMGTEWNGNTFVPVNRGNFTAGDAFLEDLGSPLDPYLNGLIARTGAITLVRVGGAVGDVIAQGAEVVEVIANFDRSTPAGRFDGLVGTVYGTRISRVSIGDGIAPLDATPLANVGVFADNDIVLVVGDTIAGANIRSAIIAANSIPDDEPLGRDGIDRVELQLGGDYIDAHIASELLDGFWISHYAVDDRAARGDIFDFVGRNADFFRSEMFADNILSFRLFDGFYDASSTNALGRIDLFTAQGYRNSTITGGELEFHPNEILVGEDLARLQTFSRAGDMSDLRVDVLGNISEEISARNFSRVRIDVDNFVNLIQAEQNIRGSSFVLGRLESLTTAADIQSSSITIVGVVERISAGGSIVNTSIAMTGPDGRIDLVRAAQSISGSISASGPIALVEATAGDIVAHVSTTTARGNVTLLTAGRDLVITTDISGNIDRLVAGRHIGRQASPGVIHVRGNLAEADARNGQIYNDIRIGQALTGVIRVGAVSSTPSNNLLSSASFTAFGRIAAVEIAGDFNGSITSFSGGIGTVTITNGSFLPGNTIAAFDGDIQRIHVVAGHLLGNIHTDDILYELIVDASADGVFGDIGINPDLFSGTAYDALRNQLPPGVGADGSINGPVIRALRNIGLVRVSGGSVFEATIHAGHAIGNIEIAGDLRNDPFTSGVSSVIAVGDSIFSIVVGGSVRNALVIAGISSFGPDARPGGADDVMKHGFINAVAIAGDAENVFFSAGMTAGADGVYNSGDERVVPGHSYVNSVSVSGAISNTSVFADSHIDFASPGIATAGLNFALLDPEIEDMLETPGVLITPGVPFAFSAGGDTGTILFTGPGTAFWDEAGNRVVLVSTTLASELRVSADDFGLTDFDIVTNDDASVGLIHVIADLLGDSDINVDCFTRDVIIGYYLGSGSIRLFGDNASVTIGTFAGGTIAAAHINNLLISGDYGVPTSSSEASITMLSAGAVSITGNNFALVNVTRGIGSFSSGPMTLAAFRAGDFLGSFSAASLERTRVSSNNGFGSIAVAGNMLDSSFIAGGDLGSDGAFGGSGLNADTLGTGSIGPVTIGGDMRRSDIIAGALRGPDAFFGTSDDSVAEGRGHIASVTVAGDIAGSNINSQAFRVLATGTIGAVTSAGAPQGDEANFAVRALGTQPLPIQVTDLRVLQESRIFRAILTFNQAMDSSSFASALSVSEVRPGDVTIRLVLGTDYTLSYDPDTFALSVIFSREVTERNLPVSAGVPGPGIYRFELDPALIGAQLIRAQLDGNADGFSSGTEPYSADDIVGDAGDKLAESDTGAVDFYAPINLDTVLDSNSASDGLADPNRIFTIRGTIGDHPDHSISTFPAAGDFDIYQITLQAGQILRLGAPQGSALLALRYLVNSDGTIIFGPTSTIAGFAFSFFSDTAQIMELPRQTPALDALTAEDNVLIKQTGTYYIVVGNNLTSYANPTEVLDLDPIALGVGDYSFTIEIFDDGDTGFSDSTDAGNGETLVNAPLPILFAGADTIFDTADDLSTVVIGAYSFTLDRGPDGIPNTADDVVSGSNSSGVTATRANGQLTSTIAAAIGPAGHAGFPDRVYADADVFHLNDGNAIPVGTLIRATVKLTELGADLGARDQTTRFVDFSGSVKLAVFDTSTSSAVDDALLVLSPSDFSPTGGTPGTIADDGQTSYGFDANGDFFVQFRAPGRVGSSGASPGSYAVMLQGAFNTDYVLEVVLGDAAAPVKQRQNIFIETRGGTVDWLEVGGLVTSLRPYLVSVLGFTGSDGGVPIGTAILDDVIANLEDAFTAAGIDVALSTNPADFEFQDFSTVFLSASVDPLTFFNEFSFGFSQHVDALNADRNDEAVVFLPSLALLGYSPSDADIASFTQSLTAAVGRRIGELLGLRLEAPLVGASSPFSIMATDSVQDTPGSGGVYNFSTTSRLLSTTTDIIADTDFFLGSQAAAPLLNLFTTAR